MAYPSGSTLLVTLQNGASPNTGPFNIYINNTSSANLITSSVSKTELSSSGYTFVTPLETFSVYAKSTGSITTADIVVIGNVPTLTKTFSITGSYDASLSASQETASVFCDPGYGLFTAGQIPVNLSNCVSAIGIGTTNISPDRNTLITVKTSESSSNYIKFFPNNSTSSVYYYHVPCISGSGTDETSLKVCADLSGGTYQTVPTNSINVYPVTTGSLTLNKPFGYFGNDNAGVIIKVNGNLVFSGSATQNYFSTSASLNFPGNALVEITSSISQSSNFGLNGVVGNQVTNSLVVNLTTLDSIYNNQIVFNGSSTVVFSGSTGVNLVSCSFIALPGANYNITSTQYGRLIYGYVFDGSGSAYISKTAACSAPLGGPTYYSFYSSPSINNTVYYINLGMTNPFPGSNAWYSTTILSGSRYPVFLNNSGLVTDYQPCGI